MKMSLLKKLAAGALLVGLCLNTATAGHVISVDRKISGDDLTLAGYYKVLIHELDFSKAKIVPPPWEDKESFKWQVHPENQAFLKKIFKEAIQVGLQENKGMYEVVTKPGKGVLELDVEVLAFMPYAAQDDTDAITKGTGDLKLSVSLRDSKTDKLIYLIEGVQAMGDEYQPNTMMAQIKGANALFHDWGRSMRKRLDKANGVKVAQY